MHQVPPGAISRGHKHQILLFWAVALGAATGTLDTRAIVGLASPACATQCMLEIRLLVVVRCEWADPLFAIVIAVFDCLAKRQRSKSQKGQ